MNNADSLKLEVYRKIEQEFETALALATDEKKNIDKGKEQLERKFQLMAEQKKVLIERKYHVKLDSLNRMAAKMETGKITSEDIKNLRVAIDELAQFLNAQKAQDLDVSLEKISEESQVVLADFKNESEQKMQGLMDSINQLQERFAVLDDAYETASFAAPVWNDMSQDNVLPAFNSVRMGKKCYEVDFGEKHGVYAVPQLIPFFAQNSLAITYASSQRVALKSLLDNILVRCLMTLRAGKVQFHFMDGDGNGSLFFDYMKCGDRTKEDVFNKRIETSRVLDVLGELYVKYREIDQSILKGDNIDSYNQNHPKSVIPYRIVVIDHVESMSPDMLLAAARLMKDELNSGLHFIFLIEETQANSVSDLLNSPVIRRVSLNDNILQGIDKTMLPRVFESVEKQLNINDAMLFGECEYYKDLDWGNNDCSNFTRIPLGMSNGENYDIEFDEEGKKLVASCSAIIGGSTGCGKSSLLHTLIVGASLRYTPDQLHFILIDMKAVEFKQYEVERLPHAEFIALKADPKIGCHILDVICRKITERENLFKKENCTKYKDYVEEHPGQPLPRYVIFIDEYQELFREDRLLVIDYLDKITRLGRALGFNLVLSSQTLNLPSEITANISHRIAMKCPTDVAREILGEYDDRTAGLKVGQFVVKAPLGKACVNTYYLPEKESDAKGTLTRTGYLREIRKRWMERKGGHFDERMVVFDRDAPALLENNRYFMNLKPVSGCKEVWFSPGERFMIDGTDFMCKFKREKNENLLVVGGNPSVSVRTLDGIVMSMEPQFADKVKVDVMNLANLFEENRDNMIGLAKRHPGWRYSENGDELDRWLDEILTDIDQRREGADDAPRFIVVYNSEKCKSLKMTETIDELYGTTVLCKSETTEKLLRIMKEGPQKGVHCLLHCSDPDSYFGIFKGNENDGEKEVFRHRVILKMNEEFGNFYLNSFSSGKHALELVDNKASEAFKDNLALYFNTWGNAEEKIKPYDYYKKGQSQF